MKALPIINQFSELDNRIGLDEQPAVELLLKILNLASIKYLTQSFDSYTPKYSETKLVVDGQAINCLPCGLRSGKITSNYNLISSLTSSQNFIDTPNINFNPLSDEICLCNFYFAPALAISRLNVPKIMKAKKIEGLVKVRKHKYKAWNILIGNSRNPQNIVFAHYDAYFSGALDNASGVGVVTETIGARPHLLSNNLFVLCGNEELSFDYPVYWGRSFRQFDKTNIGLLARAEKIFVIDCVGNSRPFVSHDQKLIKLAFPIGNRPAILAKTGIITAIDFDALMRVYHGPEDTSEKLSVKYLDQSILLLQKLLT